MDLVGLGGLTIFRMNADWSELLALAGDGFVARPRPDEGWLEQYIPPDATHEVMKAVAEAIENRSSFNLTHQVWRADGSVGWVTAQAIPTFAPDGSIVDWVGLARDITDERLAELTAAAQVERQAFLLALADEVRDLTSPRSVMQHTARTLGQHLQCGRVRYVELDSAQSTFASSAEWANAELGVDPVDDRFSLSQLGPKFLEDALQGRNLQFDDVRKDPRTREQADLFLSFQLAAGIAVPLYKGGRLLGALSIHHPEPRRWTADEVELVKEIAERTWAAVQRSKAESELRETEAELQLALAVARLGCWHLDLETNELSASAEFKGLFGYGPDAAFTLDMLSEAIVPEDEPAARAAVDEAIAKKASFEITYRCIVDGQLRWIEAIGRYDDSGRSGGRLVGVGQDITDHKLQEEARRLDAERLRLIIDSARDYAILTTDEAGTITSWNQGAERILGFSEDEAIGQHARIFFTPEDIQSDRPEREMEQAQSTGRAEDERWHLRKDGSRFWASGQMVPLQGEGMSGFLKIFRDLTEKQAAEERTRLLIDELNHRVKNTLATVQSIASQTLKGADIDSSVRQALDGRLRALARSHDLLTSHHWKGATLDEVVQLALKPFIGEGNQNVSVAGPEVALEPKAAVSLGLAVHELATNAAKHGALVDDEGAIDISWRLHEGCLTFFWRENTTAASPNRSRTGFGTRLLEEAVPYELDATTRLEFLPHGIEFRLEMPFAGSAE